MDEHGSPIKRTASRVEQRYDTRYNRTTFTDVFHYFPIVHNALCLPPKFGINYCREILLGGLHIPKSIPHTVVYAKFGRQTECIMGNWKIENGLLFSHFDSNRLFA